MTKSSKKILIIDDEEITANHLAYSLQKEGFDTITTYNGNDGWDIINKQLFDIIVSDIRLPGMDGITLLQKVKDKYPFLNVIMITGYASVESVVLAMKNGAEDYITKPFNVDELIIKINKIISNKKLLKENHALKVSLGMNNRLPMIGNSQRMKEIEKTILSLNESNCNILLIGETGTGKGLTAKFIHNSSTRQNHPFIAINCAVFTEELLASELFGHEKGAFTGATSTKQGLMEIADEGTLFLDEITETPISIQAKLLKVIEEGEFYRVGGTRLMKVDVRIISASNQNINYLISQNRFRNDLYYRLNIMEISIPPLRDRKSDIPILSQYFLQKHLPKYKKNITGFSKASLDILMDYSFPGNVRELENIVERAIILENTQLITPSNLPNSLATFKIETNHVNQIKTLDEINKEYAEKVLNLVGGNKTHAAEVLGISRTSLWRILKKSD